MLKEASQKVTTALVGAGIVPEEQRELYAYGFRSLFLQALNLSTVILLGAVLGMMWEGVLFTAVFLSLRTYTGGVHAKSPVTCYFASAGMVAAALLFCRYVDGAVLLPVNGLLMAVSVLAILKLAPVASASKPLDDAERTHFRKVALCRLAAAAVLWSVLMVLGQYRFGLLVSMGCFLPSMLMTAGKLAHRISHAPDPQ